MEIELKKLPCEQFLQRFEIFPPVSHGRKREKFENAVEIAHKAVVLILLSL